MQEENRGMLIVLSGPSGAGKDSIINRLLEKDENINISVSVTTRSPRKGETDGKDYLFVSREEFEDMIHKGKMIEYTEYCGNYYGTSKDYINKMLANNKDIILEIEVKGGSQIRQKFKECISIFILPPSLDILEYRLISRGLDSEAAVNARLDTARKEIFAANEYDYIVVNDNLDECVDDILTIISAERMKSSRVSYLVNEVLKSEKTVS